MADFKLAVGRLVDELLSDPSTFPQFKKGFDAFQVAEKLGAIKKPSYISEDDKDWLRVQTGLSRGSSSSGSPAKQKTTKTKPSSTTSSKKPSRKGTRP